MVTVFDLSREMAGGTRSHEMLGPKSRFKKSASIFTGPERSTSGGERLAVQEGWVGGEERGPPTKPRLGPRMLKFPLVLFSTSQLG